MMYDPRFGPVAQTPRQRANVLRQLRTTYPSLGYESPTLANGLFARYVAGELTWADVRRTLDTTPPERPQYRAKRGA